MKRTNGKVNLAMTGVIAALVLMLWLQRSPDGPTVLAGDTNQGSGFWGSETVNEIMGHVVYSGAVWGTGDWDGDGNFDILSFSHGVSRDLVDGAPEFQEFVITKEVDKSTPKLAKLVAEGLLIPAVEIHLTASLTSRQSPYLTYQLKNVMVTNYKIKGSGQSGGPPVEEVAFIFDKITVIHTDYDADGQPQGDTVFTYQVR